MHYRLLGPTQALRDDGTPVAVGGARLRALLTALALRAGRTVPAATLVDEVWHLDPPADAPAALQALVGRLRRALGHGAVASADGGYRLAADPGDVDLHRFERLAADGTRALAGGEPGRADALLGEALALWRGPVLADLPDRAGEATGWEARRLEARRAQAAARIALGRAEEALPELAALCGEHPLDEPLQALRIRALRDAGRAAQALAAFEAVRQELADRLGTDPGPGLRALHGELLNPAPAAHPAPAVHPTPAAPPPARAAARPGNLRERLTSFVGREDDLAAIRGDLDAARLVTLLGPGGAGKTRLSQEAAESLPGEACPDGVWLVELAPVDDAEDVPEAVLGALGARETVLRGAGAEELRAVEGAVDVTARLAEYCADRRMLLVLDNCEHVVDAAAALAERLLERCPGLRVLATSREPLGVPGELVRPVGPLPEPKALRLLGERGAAARPGFSVDGDRAACAEICRRLDGLPLAIELAAARLRLLTPRQIADRLDDRFRLLTSGSRTVLPRQQTLRAVVDWSWDLLDEPERAVLRRLSVFAGGCDLAAAEAVCGPEALDLLGSLVDKSLVVAAPDAGGEMRYRLLETVGEYAAERLDAAGDRAGTERRHLVHYRELARTTDPSLRDARQERALALFQREYENLRTALRRAVAARDEQEGLCLVLGLAWYWQMRDLRSDAMHWSGAVAALSTDPFARGAAPAEPLDEAPGERPPPWRDEVIEEARRGVWLISHVTVERAVDDWTGAERGDLVERMAAVYRPGLPQTCRFPASLWSFAVMLTGDAERLMLVLDETVRTCRERGYDWELAAVYQMRANVLANRGDTAQEAVGDAERSLELFRACGDAWGQVEALAALGEAREHLGRYEEAAEDFRTAAGMARRVGAHGQVALLRARYAAMLCELGRGAEGEAVLREVLGGGTTRESVREASLAARLFLAMELGRTGRAPEARLELERLAADFTEGNMAVFEGFRIGGVAWLDCVEGDYAAALPRVRTALDASRKELAMMVAPQMAAVHVATAAWALAGLGADDPGLARDGARLLGAFEGLLPKSHVSSSMERHNLERAERTARAVLGDAAFEAAYAEGDGLTMEEAAALI
ncbi:BTAD domain-containing putative transcriptional regulator [Streptomyces sp. NPDC001941]|uniref:ATP-binding protein n=1 Tax=Streptomyces sp. NPDC001941 TaxID=3154659 RepID=UPI00332E8390